MKMNSLINSVAACVIALTITACDKAKTDADKLVDSTKDAAGKMADTAKDAAGKAMDAAKDTATKAVDAAKDAVAGPFTDAVASAKKALDEKNYQGALDALKKLSDVQLSAEQQKVVDEIKDEATKLMSGAAAGATDAIKAALPK